VGSIIEAQEAQPVCKPVRQQGYRGVEGMQVDARELGVTMRSNDFKPRLVALLEWSMEENAGERTDGMLKLPSPSADPMLLSLDRSTSLPRGARVRPEVGHAANA
jgi:hypothetical protein